MKVAAYGKTFDHKEDFSAYGWTWNGFDKQWEIEVDSMNSRAVAAFRNLDGVSIEEIPYG